MLFNPFAQLDDLNLEASLHREARKEREANADIILHLLVVRDRRIHLSSGYDSLFSYCTAKLGFSRSSAYRRKAIVDQVEKFPSLVDRLRDGRLQLCAAAAIAPYLSEESAEALMDEVKGLSHREVESYLIKNWRTKTYPTPSGGTPAPLAPSPSSSSSLEFRDNAPGSQNARSEPPSPRTVVRPISADTSRLNVTLNDRTLDLLKRAKELLGGKSDDEILRRSLDALLEKIDPVRRHARRVAKKEQTKKTACDDSATIRCGTLDAPSRDHARRTPDLATKDQVIAEASGQCSYHAADGTRCQGRTFLEIDHVRPWALGGATESENLQPLCRKHNLLRATKTFGPWIKRSLRNRNVDPSPSVP